MVYASTLRHECMGVHTSEHAITFFASLCTISDRLRLGAEVGGRLLFVPSARRLSNPPMSLLRCT